MPTLSDLYRCPAQIIGLGFDERIYAPAGLDGFEAIFNALHLIGQLLDLKAKEFGLTNRHQGAASTILNWTGKYQSIK